MLKITDIYGSEFRFLIGDANTYSREVEKDATYYMEEFLKALPGYG